MPLDCLAQRLPHADGQLWPVRPPLQQDELLSSWLIRTARQNGIRPYVFCSAVWGKKPVWNRDLDWLGDPALIAELARQAGIPDAQARQSTLGDFEGRVFFEHRLNRKTPWILPIGVFHRLRRKHGLQFCPACLREDGRDAYFRRWWRLAFVTSCARHGMLLFDGCAQCDSPLSPHRLPLGDEEVPIATCASCGHDLTTVKPVAADPRVIAFQHHLERVARTGYCLLSGHVLYGPAYFVGLHQLMRLLATGRASQRLRSALGRLLDLQIEAPRFCGPAREIELLRTTDRHSLFRGVAGLISDWPRTFVALCQRERIWSSAVLKDMEVQPFFFSAPIVENLYRASYKVADGELRAAAKWLWQTTGVRAPIREVRRFLSTDSTRPARLRCSRGADCKLPLV